MKSGGATTATPRHGGGSFTRIEVVSMLKIATLCVGAALLQVLFTFVGYGGAPPVAMVDFTSQVSQCVPDAFEFSPSNFASCAASTNVTTGSRTDDATSIVDALLRLRETEQATMLGCLLDQCSNMTTRPFFVADPDTQLVLAHYAFGIDGLTQKNRYFYLEVAFPNANRTGSDWTFDVTLTPHVRGYYYTDSDKKNESFVDVLPDRRSLDWTVTCREGEFFCDSQYFLRVTDIDFVRFRIDVLFNATQALPINGRAPRFRKTWGAAEFTNWMLGVKYFFLVVSGLCTISYARNLSLLRASEQTMEQNWVLALGVALVLYDDPFYLLEATTGGSSLKILSVLFQATFFQMLLLFWLIALDNMRLQGCEAGVSNAAFFGPKVAFSGFFWLIQVVYHGYIKYYSTNDPMWDPLATNTNFALLRAMMALLSLTYMGWFLTLCVLSRHEVRAKRARYKYLLALSLWMVVTCFLGLGAGSFSPTPTSGGAWTSYTALFNLYVCMLEYLYAPSASTIRAATARQGAYGKAVADPEASPALASPQGDTPDADAEAEAETAGVQLDLA